MPIIEIAKIQVRRGQESQGQVPQLAPGELAWAEDTQNLYIGKRISEGANSDANTRILTDKDLGNILQQAISVSAAQNVSISSTSTAYRFKNYIPYNNLGATGTTYATISQSFATKLDNWVSLTDFAPNGIWPPPVSNDVTTILQQAIGIVGSNPTQNGGGVVFQNGTVDMPVSWAYTTAAVPAQTGIFTATVYNAGNIVLNTQVLGPAFQTGTYITGLVSSGTTAIVTLSKPTTVALTTTTISYTTLSTNAAVGASSITVANTNGITTGSVVTGVGFDPTTTATSVQIGAVTTVTLSTRMIASTTVASGSAVQFVKAGTSIEFINSPSGYTFNPALGPLAIKIPAGNWNISAPVLLPPYTTLIGEGAGMTTLTYSGIVNSNNPMFKTVDAYGVPYEGVQLSTVPQVTRYQSHTAGYNPGNVTIKNMTLAVTNITNTLTNNAIVSLDNASNVLFENVNIGNMNNAGGTLASGLLVGVDIRTDMNAPSDVTMSYSSNLQFKNCQFNGIAVGIRSTGTVNRFYVENSKFSSLINGIQGYSDYGPVFLNGLVSGNRFETIANEAMVIGIVAINGVVRQNTFFTSENNTFFNVGNFFRGETKQLTHVLNFNDLGCKSINDYFDRQYNAASTSSLNVHWLSKATVATSNQLQRVQIPSLTSQGISEKVGQYSSILNMPLLEDRTQMWKIDYFVSNQNLVRKGQLVVNLSTAGNVLSPDGWGDVSDNYTYFDTGVGVSGNWQWTTDMKSSQPAIQTNSVSPYVVGSIVANALTGTNQTSLILNTQRPVSTATITTSLVDNPDFSLWSPGNPGSTSVLFFPPNIPGYAGPTFEDGTNQAYLSAAAWTPGLTNQLFCTFVDAAGVGKQILHLTTGTAVVFVNQLVSWTAATSTSYRYYVLQDPNQITLYSDTYVSSATISVRSAGGAVRQTNAITSWSTSTYRGYSAVQLNFTPATTYAIQPSDSVYVTMYPSQFYNYVTLSLFNNDINTQSETNVLTSVATIIT
jgi:hypothetical protein